MSRPRRRGQPGRQGRERTDGDRSAVLADAQALAARGEIDRAFAILGALLGQHPQLAPAWHLEGVLLLATGRPAEAVAALGRATKLAPRDAAAWTNLGIAQHQAGGPKEAEASLRHAIRLQPASAQAHLNLGVVLREKGDSKDALVAFRQAVAIDTGYAKGWLELGRMLARRDQADEALRCLARAGPQPDALEQAGLIEQSRGRLAAAIRHLRACLEREPGRASATLALGWCLQETGAVDEALELYHALLKRDPALFAVVERNLTTASKGRLWLRPAALRRALLG